MSEYSSKQISEIAQAKKVLSQTGKPEKVAQINALMAAEAPFSKISAIINDKSAGPEMPPTSGKGSGVNAWKEYAKAVSDLDPETIDDMTKDDLIAVLTDEG